MSSWVSLKRANRRGPGQALGFLVSGQRSISSLPPPSPRVSASLRVALPSSLFLGLPPPPFLPLCSFLFVRIACDGAFGPGRATAIGLIPKIQPAAHGREDLVGARISALQAGARGSGAAGNRRGPWAPHVFELSARTCVVLTTLAFRRGILRPLFAGMPPRLAVYSTAWVLPRTGGRHTRLDAQRRRSWGSLRS